MMKNLRAEIDEAELEIRKDRFTASVQERHSITTHLFWIFLLTWFCAWGASALLRACNLTSMPVRYAIAFLSAYAAFYGLVKWWISNINWSDGSEKTSNTFWNVVGGLVLGFFKLFKRVLPVPIVLPIVAVIVTLLLMSAVAAPLLAEVVFEVMFAGIVVRSLKGKVEIGDWHIKLFQLTWLPALVIGTLLCAVAWSIQNVHPQVTTIGEAVKFLTFP